VASERVEWLHRQVGLYNAGDLEGFLDALPPGFTFTPDPSFPDADAYGGDDLRMWMGEWARMWEESRLEILETTELGSTMIAKARWHLTSAATGPRILDNDFSLVIWFDDDRPRRAAAFFDEDRAREAAKAGTG